LSLVFIGGDTIQATSFGPATTASLADSTPGANSDLTTTLALSAPDSNFGTLMTFTPPEFFVAADADVPDGASALFLKSQATLGLINGPCAPAGLAPEFNMMDATADINGPTVGFNDTDDPGSLGEIFEDDNGDTIPNGAPVSSFEGSWGRAPPSSPFHFPVSGAWLCGAGPPLPLLQLERLVQRPCRLHLYQYAFPPPAPI